MEKALKGQRKALEYLYKKNKQNVFYVAKCLLLDENRAERAAVRTFESLLEERASWKMKTEEEFSNAAIQTLVSHCKSAAIQKNSKAFRIPQNRNFRISETGTYDGARGERDFVLNGLSDLQRFAFVLRALCGYDVGQMADVLKISDKILSAVLEEEKGNVEKLMEAAGKTGEGSYERLVNELREMEKDLLVSQKAEEKILAMVKEAAGREQRKRKTGVVFAGVAFLACVCVAAFLSFGPESGQEQKKSEAETKAYGTEGSKNSGTYADIAIQDYGKVTIKLDADAAPVSVENFIRLANDGFYDGLTFHRIMEGFMMQGGDPNGNGMGGSDETIVGEFAENGYENPLSHVRGAVAMARSKDYNSASSQFYIVQKDSLFLDGSYAVFGNVTEGMEIVDAICESSEPTDNDGTIPAEKQPVITSVTIRAE